MIQTSYNEVVAKQELTLALAQKGLHTQWIYELVGVKPDHLRRLCRKNGIKPLRGSLHTDHDRLMSSPLKRFHASVFLKILSTHGGDTCTSNDIQNTWNIYHAYGAYEHCFGGEPLLKLSMCLSLLRFIESDAYIVLPCSICDSKILQRYTNKNDNTCYVCLTQKENQAQTQKDKHVKCN